MTDGKEREKLMRKTSKAFVNLCRQLHISLIVDHINWLVEERMIEIYMQSRVKGQGRKSLQSPLIQADATSIMGGDPDHDYMCLYIVCNQCVL